MSLFNDSITRNLLLLLAVFTFGYGSLVGLHIVLERAVNSLDIQIQNEQSRYKIGEHILQEINTVESLYYKMALLTNINAARLIKQDIHSHLSQIYKALDVLEDGGVLEKSIHLNLVGLSKSIEEVHFTPLDDESIVFESVDLRPKLKVITDKMDELIAIIDTKHTLRNTHDMASHRKAAIQIELFLKQLPPHFIRMKENTGRLLHESKQNAQTLETTILSQKRYYANIEIFVTIAIVFLVILLGYGILRKIQLNNQELKAITEKARLLALEASQANSAKSQFLANMSHEIRTPLNAIVGFSELLSESELPEKSRENATIIAKSSKALLGIINDILDISKVESGKFDLTNEPFHTKETFEQVVELFSIKAKEKNIRLFYEPNPQIPTYILGDAVRLKQVLSNLISNAIKFTPDSKRVFFKIEHVRIVENQSTLKFRIIDEGIGISENQRDKIFEPFSQADSGITRMYGGTGLGLTISMAIIQMMGGSIEVESKFGEGSEFYFELTFPIAPLCEIYPDKIPKLNFAIMGSLNDELMPSLLHILEDFGSTTLLNSADSTFDNFDLLFCSNSNQLPKNNFSIPIITVGPKDFGSQYINVDVPLYSSKIYNLIADLCHIEQSAAKTSIEASDTFCGHVLVAEDNPTNQQLISILLEKYGLTFIIAKDGKEAIEVYKKGHFDLVLMDINMPIMDGVSSFKAIREYEEKEELPPAPIVALTANAIVEDIERYTRLGMNGYLAKPIHMPSLLSTFKKFLSGHAQSNTIQPKKPNNQSQIPSFSLQEAMDALMLDELTVQMLLDNFALNLPKDLNELKNFIANKEENQTYAKAHYLKGSCGNLGMHGACLLLEQIESSKSSWIEKEESFEALKGYFAQALQ